MAQRDAQGVRPKHKSVLKCSLPVPLPKKFGWSPLENDSPSSYGGDVPPDNAGGYGIVRLLEAMGIERWETKQLPREDRRLFSIENLRFDELERLHKLVDKMLLSICGTLLPSSPTELYRSFREQNVGDVLLKGAIVDGVKAAKHGSTESKTLRAVLCSFLSAKEVRRLLLDEKSVTQNGNEYGIPDSIDSEEPNRETPDPTISQDLNNVTFIVPRAATQSESTVSQYRNSREVNFDGFPENRCHVNGCVIDVDIAPDLPGTATGHNCNKCRKPVHLYCCLHLLNLEVEDETSVLFCSACLGGSNVPSSTELEASPVGQNNLSTDTKGNVIIVGSRNVSMARMFQISRKHWDSILCHGKIPKVSIIRTRCSDQSIREAVRFIFLPENVQLLSWGTKRIRVVDKWVEFPAVLRKVTTEKLFRDYKSRTPAGVERENQSESALMLGRSSFIEIAEALTRGQQKRKAAVDYVLGTLVYDNLRQAREIVSREVSADEYGRILLKQLDAVEEFLKFTYLEHIDIDDDVFHSKAFALAETTTLSSENPRASSCTICLTPFQILRNIEMNLKERREDIHSSLKEIPHKTLLYMGHQHRCHNQEQRIAKMFMDLNRDEGETSAVILVDYKMKFEAIRFREKTTEFFGKKGMSWHGAVVFYNANDSASNQTEVSDTMKLSNLFFDHLISNDMTQDYVAVCSILDAILARLKIEIPSLKRFWLLSDNARCYQNDLLPIMAPFIAQKHSLHMEGIIHSETKRGKSLVDAHFALAMMHVNRYVNRKDVTTPGDVVEALNSFGGVANCTAEILHIRRDHDNLQKWTVAHKTGKNPDLDKLRANLINKSDGNYNRNLT